jgi:hypothetical protein
MKGLACGKCWDIRALSQENLEPVFCRCGNTGGWWLDGRNGVARYTADATAYAWGVGFNNSFLRIIAESFGDMGTDEEWRMLHDVATEAPSYLFDKSRRSCWVILFKPGKVASVEWATNEERAAVGLEPYPPMHALAPKVST